jgi:two-component system, NarL family, sensor histidine kinase UhpB
MTENKEQDQKTIMRAMLKAVEEERGRLGRELHDNINQILASTMLYICMADSDPANTKIHIKSAKDLLATAVSEIRDLTHGFAVPHKHINLEELITGLKDKIRNASSLRLHLDYTIREDQLSHDLKINVYRIVQEQLSNILKHAKADRVDISLKSQKGSVKVVLADNGKGFDVNVKRNGIGLSNIINRVESFNGHVEISSSPGKGCVITMQIPIDKDTTVAIKDSAALDLANLLS